MFYAVVFHSFPFFTNLVCVLCPVALDDSWKTKLEDTAADRKLWRRLTQKNILDFSKWKTKALNTQFDKLLRGLKIWYEPKKE